MPHCLQMARRDPTRVRWGNARGQPWRPATPPPAPGTDPPARSSLPRALRGRTHPSPLLPQIHPASMRALVVEDDPTSALLSRHVLEREGFTVELATTGQEAITLAA